MRYDIDKLIAARLKRGWDQTKVAYLAELSVATVCRMERRKTQKPDTIKRVAHVLGVSMDEIVVPEDEPEMVLEK